MEQPLLEMQEVEICYHGKPVVQDVSLCLKQGEILGIVGESGSGKSTLLKATMGLLGTKGAVTKGRIFYQGIDVLQAKGESLRKLRGPAMGMVFQNAGASLCPIRRIEDQLYESVLQHEKTSRKAVKERALNWFEKMRLTDGERILKSYPFELSGGMKQRVGIMMAMILKPNLLLADEPTSALDVTVQAQVVRELQQVRELYHTGMMIVTHNISIVRAMADQVAVMQHGKLVEYGEKEEVLYHPKEAYTQKLIRSVLRLER